MKTLTWSSHRVGVLAAFLLALPVLALPTAVRSEEARAGVVTKLVGTATVARATLSEPAPLRFKDDVLLRDRITTGESSAVRVLLGGKATITARERSVITITEIPGTATVGVVSGRAAIAVAKDKMKSGEIVEIRTPNAVVAVRGTVVIAEVEPVVGGGHRSTITILKGLVDVTKLDGAGRLNGSAVDVKRLERLVVTDTSPLAAPVRITKEDGESLAAQFSFVPQSAPAASTEALTSQVKEASFNEAIQAVAAIAPSTTTGTTSTATTSVANTVNSTTGTVSDTVSTVTNTISPVVTTVSAPVATTVSTVTTTVVPTVTTTLTTVVSTIPTTVSTVTAPVTTLTTVVSPASPTVPSTGGLLSGLGLGKK